jgi:hypothetical protein
VNENPKKLAFPKFECHYYPSFPALVAKWQMRKLEVLNPLFSVFMVLQAFAF